MTNDLLNRLRNRLNWLVEPEPPPRLGLVLSGGGARGAYQAGVLCFIAERHPDFHPPILTGVSAGAINAVHLASSRAETFMGTIRELKHLWETVTPEQVFESDSGMRMLRRLLGRSPELPPDSDLELYYAQRGLLHTGPLRGFLQRSLPGVAEDGTLHGIAENIRDNRLRALAVLTVNYTTGQTIAWVEGTDIHSWDRPMRRSIQTRMTVEHIMASAALPLFFPAVRLGDTWHGDGGVRLTAPLAPALHLGANRILVISTRHRDTDEEASEPEFAGYPPTAQIIGLLMNAIFLDSVDHDLLILERINQLVEQLPRRRRMGLRRVDAFVIRPSINLSALAGDFEPQVSSSFKLFMRMIGSDETKSPRWLSMLNFDVEYITRCMECGYEDARKQADSLDAFLTGAPVASYRDAY